MAFLETNSTNVPLLSNAIFRGKSTLLNSTYTTANITIKTDVSGVLNVWHSTTGDNYHTYGDDFICNGELIKQVILKGKYFYLTYRNDASPQTYLQLLCKLTNIVREGIKVDDGGGGTGSDVNIIDSVDLTITNTSFEVSNFPASQAVTLADAVTISNTSFEVSNFPASQAVTLADAVTISNTSFEVSNFPASQAVTLADAVTISNTSFEVSNFPASQAVTLADAVTISNTSFEVSNFPASQAVTLADAVAISNTSFEVSNFPANQTVTVDNNLNVNVLETNSTIYDLTNDAPTMTENDTRFIADRIRPDSWAFDTSKGTSGSNVYWYSNSSTSPLGVQQFNILHGDINSLYCVVSINKTENNNRLPFIALYSPSTVSFFTSRWVYTVDPSEKILQTEKVLLYWGNDPVDIYTNLRHIILLKNEIASIGPQLETETVFLMSTNTASGEPSNSISYNLYNTGFVLSNNTHNDYEFNSGIKSKSDLLLSRLSVSDSTNLNVNVSNTLGVTVSNTVDVANNNLDQLTFDMIDSKGTKALNVITKNVYIANITEYALADISSNNLPTIDLRAFKTISFFGNSTHVGTGSHNIIVQFSIDGITFYNSPYLISTNGSSNFAWDYKNFCVPYIRMQFQVTVTALTAFVCLK